MISSTCGRTGGVAFGCCGTPVGRGVDVGGGDGGCGVGDNVGATAEVAVMLGADVGVERRAG
jgi:hypothetical protein